MYYTTGTPGYLNPLSSTHLSYVIYYWLLVTCPPLVCLNCTPPLVHLHYMYLYTLFLYFFFSSNNLRRL